MAIGLGENGKFAVILDHLIAIQDLLDDFVEGSGMLEEWIIHFATSGGVNSQEKSLSLVLKNSLLEILFILEVSSLLERFKEWRILNGVLRYKPFNMLLHLQTVVATVDLLAHHGIWLDARPLNSISERSCFFSLTVKSFHSMLDLVEGFLLSIESFDYKSLVLGVFYSIP